MLKIVVNEEMVFCYKNCSGDREKLSKFKAEGREFVKFLRLLKQFIQTEKGQNTIRIHMYWKKYWNSETCRKSKQIDFA